ncbi:ATP-binding cassette domain-containing protein [Howardella ureilytica]
MEEDYLIKVKDLKQHFKINENFVIKAVDGISFGIKKNEIFGLVGESGCGKSTTARCISDIYRPTEGEIYYKNMLVSGRKPCKENVELFKKEMQLIFQDSSASLNPRMTVEQIVREPLVIQKLYENKGNLKDKVIYNLKRVGMDGIYLSKYPSEMSGGQRQRVCIARSLITSPSIIIADEPIASLDVSIQAQIIMLFKHLQKEHGFSMLFIAHDLSAVRFISNRIGVMLKGKLVELADTEELFNNPIHPYTKSLLSSIHIPDPLYERNRVHIEYDKETPLGKAFVEKYKDHFVLE